MKNLITSFTNSSIRYQLIIGIGFLFTALISSFTYYTTYSQSEFLRIQGIKQAKNRSMMLAATAKLWVLSNDYIGLEESIDNFKKYDDLILASVINMEGKVIAHTDRSKIGLFVADVKQISFLKKMLQPTDIHVDEGEIYTNNTKHIDIFHVIHNKDTHIAWVHLRIDQSMRQKNISMILIQGVIFTVLSLIVAIFLSYLTAYNLTKYLLRLIGTMKQIRMGAKNVRADESGTKEVHQLSKEFNLMLDTIREKEQSLINANLEIQNKEEIMLAQSRHAAMGEMISMIAHQWRQPISVISMGANNILADIELDMVDEKTLKSGAKDIINKTQELSKTIDDFRNFFRPSKETDEILPEDVFAEALSVIGKSLEYNNIEVITEFHNGKEIRTYSRELMQVLINILKNAKEALAESIKEDRKIFISVVDNDSEVFLSVCDNAGGIKEDILDKIFDPYYSTKNEKNGTGLGLYMCKTIIEKHLMGNIKAQNKNSGACFIIRLPLDLL